MKVARLLQHVLWVGLMHCLLAAPDDDLDDFEFEQLKSNSDWSHFIPEQSSVPDKGVDAAVKAAVSAAVAAATSSDKLQSNFITLDDDWATQTTTPSHAFSWHEKMLRHALAKALSNAVMRQRFVEVMPILRVMTSQQRLALSALISAQLSAQHGHELKLDKVRKMFGDDKKLLLPIMYDIANLVSKSAFKYLPFEQKTSPQHEPYSFNQRQAQLTPEELLEDEQFVGVADIEDEYGPIATTETLEILDAQSINEELQAATPATSSSRRRRRRRRRSAAIGTELVHKLQRAVPLTTLHRTTGSRMLHMNSTAFEVPTTTTSHYQQVEDLALANLNGSNVELDRSPTPITEDNNTEEALPRPEGLISGPRYRLNSNKVRLIRPNMPQATRKRVQVHSRPKVATTSNGQPLKKCERFTASMCIRTDDYPL